MGLTVFKEGDVLGRAGDAIENLMFVVKGSVVGSLEGKEFTYSQQGDMLGLCAMPDGAYQIEYRASAESNVLVSPYNGFSDFERFLKSSEDLAVKVAFSVCRQASELSVYRQQLKKAALEAYETAVRVYPEYERLCSFYSFAKKTIAEFDELTSPKTDDSTPDWLPPYYPSILKLNRDVSKEFFRSAGVSLGFLSTGFSHVNQLIHSILHYKEYLRDISNIFVDASGHDMLAVTAELHLGVASIKGADEAVGVLVEDIKALAKTLPAVDAEAFEVRAKQHEEAIAEVRGSGVVVEAPEGAAADGPAITTNLKESLYEIIEYSGLPQDETNQFVRNVLDFTKIRDRAGSDDVTYRLRRELTRDFYTIYNAVFMKSLKDTKLPTVIKMFLNFGYMDAELAGANNAAYLFSIADSFKGDASKGVYTVSEWLTAIYKGEKEPCVGDLDMDYTAHVKELVQSKRLNQLDAAKEERRLMADNEEKLRFELMTVFPIGNKITFGRISTYCPIFADHNVQRPLPQALVSPEKISETLDEIIKLDFSAFHREVAFSNPEVGINSAQIRISRMPNFILMPNVGVRGAMWQEIEGRDRYTSARVFLPAFYLEDFKTALIRLAGEFRWEMCKRIQGARWSDMSYPSLTSEYFNYLQFYRSNRDLSTDAKSAVKTEIMKARNVYRAVFVSNYIDWVAYEANGSQRLNKAARKIMFSYCPFPKEIREKLGSNPQYAEPQKLFDLKNRQEIQKLSNVMQKVTTAGKTVPQELLDEMALLEK